MSHYAKSMFDLIERLSKLPGIGPKSAERIAFFLLKDSKENVFSLANAIVKMKQKSRFCKICSNLAEDEICSICRDAKRDKSIVCVVEHPKDIIAIEKAGGFNGLYHVLLGALSPLDGVVPQNLTIGQLINRIKAARLPDGQGEIKEVIIATNSNTDGEATALYLTKILKPLKIKVSRIAYGIPVGTNLEYADQATLQKALEGRKEI